MKKSIGLVFLIFVFLTVLLSGCAPASIPEPTSTFTPMPTSTSTSTLTPIPTSPFTPTVVTPSVKIRTSIGDIVIVEVKFASKDAEGKTAASGHRIFTILFKSADGSDINIVKFFSISKDVYIKGDDGSKTTMYTTGLSQTSDGNYLTDEGVISFTPPDSAHKFTLFWRGNAPIELPLPQ